MPRETLSDRDLARLLDQQIAGMEAVLSALDAERSALSARDGEALLQAVSDKAASLASADQLERQRQSLLDQLGAPLRRGTGPDFSTDAGISQRWQQVLALTRQCRALNDANGQMIRGQRRRTEGALCILRGEPAAPAEYGPSGEQRPRGTHRSLATY